MPAKPLVDGSRWLVVISEGVEVGGVIRRETAAHFHGHDALAEATAYANWLNAGRPMPGTVPTREELAAIRELHEIAIGG